MRIAEEVATPAGPLLTFGRAGRRLFRVAKGVVAAVATSTTAAISRPPVMSNETEPPRPRPRSSLETKIDTKTNIWPSCRPRP